MPLDEYNSIKETLYILLSWQTIEDIRQGEIDLKQNVIIFITIILLKKCGILIKNMKVILFICKENPTAI
jgi:hypothetical protein